MNVTLSTRSLEKEIALEFLRDEYSIDALAIDLESVSPSPFDDEMIVRYRTTLPNYGISRGTLFIPLSFWNRAAGTVGSL